MPYATFGSILNFVLVITSYLMPIPISAGKYSETTFQALIIAQQTRSLPGPDCFS